ncbi:PREDICTED: guanine nucleotide-binding protein G(I)/G(S)/G(O) subunit gamma-10 [Myotis brandtii]|uniref:guanine nucleotide-binding protein G(I)/G(S)/G(O) subunit gamma-10 n=1 Tax=Myotis brandtii TaxID=109478 RepID=UPI0007046782|nr:PREDICTED: guanine nucleotide-binding protein G(I)/G(S)/G(O) subunit gamma-10 [Myotis brandtii]
MGRSAEAEAEGCHWEIQGRERRVGERPAWSRHLQKKGREESREEARGESRVQCGFSPRGKGICCVTVCGSGYRQRPLQTSQLVNNQGITCLVSLPSDWNAPYPSQDPFFALEKPLGRCWVRWAETKGSRVTWVSQAAAELQQYCMQNACKDALLVGVPAGSNPFREPRSCALL